VEYYSGQVVKHVAFVLLHLSLPDPCILDYIICNQGYQNQDLT